MEYEIYIDVVFAINFFMNTIIFWIAGKLSRMAAKPVRLLAGAAFAALLYCILALSQVFRPYFNFFTMLSVLMIGLLITYNPKTIKNMIKLVVFSNVAAFAVGGAGFAFFYYTNIGDIIGNVSLSIAGNLSFKILAAATAAAYIIIKFAIYRINKISINKQSFCTVRILWDREISELTALVDTGNSLSDPLTKAPVVIVEFDKLKTLLPAELKLLYYENRDDDIVQMAGALADSRFSSRLRIIPFNSLGKQNGMLIGFKPDSLEIISTDCKSRKINEAIVGITGVNLSADGSYQALLSPNILSANGG